jgi:hypothetical protein
MMSRENYERSEWFRAHYGATSGSLLSSRVAVLTLLHAGRPLMGMSAVHVRKLQLYIDSRNPAGLLPLCATLLRPSVQHS